MPLRPAPSGVLDVTPLPSVGPAAESAQSQGPPVAVDFGGAAAGRASSGGAIGGGASSQDAHSGGADTVSAGSGGATPRGASTGVAAGAGCPTPQQ
ncbi:unnamed protein product [Closterium sp. NIES-54]